MLTTVIPSGVAGVGGGGVGIISNYKIVISLVWNFVLDNWTLEVFGHGWQTRGLQILGIKLLTNQFLGSLLDLFRSIICLLIYSIRTVPVVSNCIHEMLHLIATNVRVLAQINGYTSLDGCEKYLP